MYEESLILCLFPHYFSNLLSVLLLNEMTRILERSKAEDYLLSTYILERHIKEKIEVFEKDIDLFFDCDLELNEISILKEMEIVINKTVYKYSKNKFYIYNCSVSCNRHLLPIKHYYVVIYHNTLQFIFNHLQKVHQLYRE